MCEKDLSINLIFLYEKLGRNRHDTLSVTEHVFQLIHCAVVWVRSGISRTKLHDSMIQQTWHFNIVRTHYVLRWTQTVKGVSIWVKLARCL
jgi:hypothetical protein